jgi:hypothetical protein
LDQVQRIEQCPALLDVDACSAVRGNEGFVPLDAVGSINMNLIAPSAAAIGLISGAGRLLQSGGSLFLYKPCMYNGDHSAPSNATFEKSLKARNPA